MNASGTNPLPANFTALSLIASHIPRPREPARTPTPPLAASRVPGVAVCRRPVSAPFLSPLLRQEKLIGGEATRAKSAVFFRAPRRTHWPGEKRGFFSRSALAALRELALKREDMRC